MPDRGVVKEKMSWGTYPDVTKDLGRFTNDPVTHDDDQHAIFVWPF
jgi:hypothetical protein